MGSSPKETFEILKNMKQGEEPLEYNYKDFIANLRKQDEAMYSLLCLLELYRISSRPDLFSTREMDKIVDGIINVLKKEKLDEKLNLNLDLSRYEMKFINLMNSVKPENKKILQNILKDILEKSSTPEVLIRKILDQISRDKEYNNVFINLKRSHQDLIYKVLAEMEDKDYIAVFCNLEGFPDLELRKIGEGKSRYSVKNVDKLRYVKKAIEKGFINEALVLYYNDKDRNIRQALASQRFAFNKGIITRFLNDNDASVRGAIIDNLDLEESISQDIEVYERTLDINEDVRQKTFIFYDKVYNFVKVYFETDYLKKDGDKLNEDCKSLEKSLKRSKMDSKNQDQSEAIQYFIKFTLFLFKGLCTSIAQEYEAVLDRYNFSLNFYHEFFEETGIEKYAKVKSSRILDGVGYQNLDEETKKTFFIIYKGSLTEGETRKLIKENLESAMYLLKDKEILSYLDIILEALQAKSINLQLFITILERLLPYKEHCPAIVGSSENQLLISSYLCKEKEVNSLEDSFGKTFFIIKTGLKDCVPESLSDGELYELIVASDSSDVLSWACDRILEHSEGFYNIHKASCKYRERILSSTSDDFFKGHKSNIFFYFCMGGKVKVCDLDFFVSLLFFIANSSSNKLKVGKFLKMYLASVPTKIYHDFASICYNLKTKSMYPLEEQEIDKIKAKDEMLYFLISVVLNFNVYKISEIEYNLGQFYDVKEENMQMVLSRN